MLSLKPARPLTEAQIRVELSSLAPQIAAAEDSRQTAADAVVNGDNPNVYTAACANEGKLKARRDMLSDALPKAIKREAEKAEAARSEKEKADAEAANQARITTHRGAVKMSADMVRLLVPISEHFSAAAKATADALKSEEGWALKIPDGVFGRVTYAGEIKQHVADELARAFGRYDLPAPSHGEVRDQPAAEWRKLFKATLDDVAKCTILEGKRFGEVDPPKYQHRTVRLAPHRPAGYRTIRGDPRAGPSWRTDPLTGETRQPTAAEIESDLRIGPPLGRVYEEASGTPGVQFPGRYNDYTDAAGALVARFMQSSPVVSPLDNADRVAEQAWIAAGQPDLQPGAPGFVEPAAETRHHVAAFAKPAVEQHVLLEADPAVLGPIDTGREAAEAWLASRNGGRPAPLEPPDQPISDHETEY